MPHLALGKTEMTNKKPKTAQVMCDQVTRIGDSAEASHSSFRSFMKQDEANCVNSVMDVSTPVESGPNMDLFRHELATAIALSW